MINESNIKKNKEIERYYIMTDVATQITLGQYMSKDTLGPLLKKRLFGGYEVPFGSCIFNVSTWLFQKGAILGRARFDRLNILVRLLTTSGKEDDFCNMLMEVAEKRLADFGKEPDSFPTFWLETGFSTLDLTDVNMLKTRMPLAQILSYLDFWLSSGIGFGASYPDLVEKMWEKTFNTPIDQHEWARARESGLDIPEKQTMLPLDDMEHHVLLEVGRYVSEYFPQLLESLGLKIT